MTADHDAPHAVRNAPREMRIEYAKPPPSDHDAPREMRIEYAKPDTAQEPRRRSGEATARPQPRSNAQAAARYRARQRGEEVPKRKPGPKPTGQTDLRLQNRKLHSRITELEGLMRIARQQLDRRTLTVEQAARDLLKVLGRDDPAVDSPERQVLLRDLLVEIEDRQEQWRN